MAVYVDDVRHAFGRMVMCHMWSDNIKDLLAMADRIGVQRKWIQGHPTLSFGKHREASWIHFDVSLGAKTKAIAAGAILTDRYGPIEHVARLNIASGDPLLIENGNRQIKMIIKSRTLRSGSAKS